VPLKRSRASADIATMNDSCFSEAVRNATEIPGAEPLDRWLLARASAVDGLVRMAAAEEADVARQRRIGRYAPRISAEPPGHLLRRQLIRSPTTSSALQNAIVSVIALGWLMVAPESDDGYRDHPEKALWDAWTATFVANNALEGVEWEPEAHRVAGVRWEEALRTGGLWPRRGHTRQRVLVVPAGSSVPVRRQARARTRVRVRRCV
jgi:hypothetical protein